MIGDLESGLCLLRLAWKDLVDRAYISRNMQMRSSFRHYSPVGK